MPLFIVRLFHFAGPVFDKRTASRINSLLSRYWRGGSLSLLLCLLFCRTGYALPPSELVPSEVARQDAELERIEGPYPGLLLLPHGESTFSDGKYGQPYHAACYIYAGESISGAEPKVTGYGLRFVVHAPDAESLPVTKRVGRMLLTLYGMNREKMRHDHPFRENVEVWLTREGVQNGGADAGGEQFKNQIYMYNLFQTRQPVEWAREVAHEYGHYALPGISGFTAPEEWANGVLGERLFLKWLQDDLRAGLIKSEDLPFVTPEQLNDYLTRQVAPLLRRIARDGVNEHNLGRRDAAGMDEYTAIALYLDSVYGSRALLDAMAYTTPKPGETFVNAREFWQGAQASLQGTTSFTVTPPVFSKEQATSFMLFLPRGDWTVSAEKTREWELPTDSKGLYVRGKNHLLVTLSDWRKLKLTPTQASTPAHLIFRKTNAQLP